MVTPLLPGTLVAGALDLDVVVLLPLLAVILPPLTRPGRNISMPKQASARSSSLPPPVHRPHPSGVGAVGAFNTHVLSRDKAAVAFPRRVAPRVPRELQA